MKAHEVSIDGKVIGVYIPPEGEPFAAMIGNIPRTYATHTKIRVVGQFDKSEVGAPYRTERGSAGC